MQADQPPRGRCSPRQDCTDGRAAKGRGTIAQVRYETIEVLTQYDSSRIGPYWGATGSLSTGLGMEGRRLCNCSIAAAREHWATMQNGPHLAERRSKLESPHGRHLVCNRILHLVITWSEASTLPAFVSDGVDINFSSKHTGLAVPSRR